MKNENYNTKKDMDWLLYSLICIVWVTGLLAIVMNAGTGL